MSIMQPVRPRNWPRHVAPVEYAVAVGRYLTSANLSQASRRIYRISLTGWAWPLVGQPMPVGRRRRGAAPPVVALAELDAPDIRARLATAIAERAGHADARTVNRELSALRSAVGWWQDQGWIRGDPTVGLRHVRSALQPLPPLTERQLSALWRSDACLREHALWHLLYDSASPALTVLALDASEVDLERCRSRGSGTEAIVTWTTGTSDLLAWLLAGRRHGPVFLTGRRASAQATGSDVCPLTGRARMSYRRAAEIFTGHTAALDPTGRGWTLHQLRRPGQPRRPSMASSLV